jgi:hypothetical protein
VRQNKRLLHLCPVRCDLLPLVARFDESVGGDDGMGTMLAHNHNIIGILVGCHGRVAVHAHLELGKLLAVCLKVLWIGH